MRRLLVAATVLVILVLGGFLAMRMFAAPPADLDLARSKSSAQGLYRVTIAPEAEPLEQGPLHAWIATVETADGIAVEDATITVDGGMPAHGHGLPTSPEASGHLGDGRYRIDGVRFNMGGWWVLRLAIEGSPGADDVEFNLVL